MARCVEGQQQGAAGRRFRFRRRGAPGPCGQSQQRPRAVLLGKAVRCAAGPPIRRLLAVFEIRRLSHPGCENNPI